MAAGLLADFPDGVWLVELAPLVRSGAGAASDRRGAGPAREASRPMLDQLGDHLRARRLLLVLDNCEHLLDACADLAERCCALRPACGSWPPAASRWASPARRPGACRRWRRPIRSTCRRWLHWYASRRCGCSSSGRRGAAGLRRDGGERAGGGPDLLRGWTASRWRSSWPRRASRALPVEQIAARLDDRFRLLTGGSRTALPRQQTLRATIDWSYDLLSEPERALLRRLSVFAGGWTLEAAEAVCAAADVAEGEVLDLLAQLVDKSLVILEGPGDGGRYRLLETVRQYALELLEENGEVLVWRQRHASFFLALAEEAEPKLYGPEQEPGLRGWRLSTATLRAALEWLAAQGDAEQGLRLAGALWRFWEVVATWLRGGRGWRRCCGWPGRTPMQPRGRRR